jgi:hypothetical protein
MGVRCAERTCTWAEETRVEGSKAAAALAENVVEVMWVEETRVAG